MADNSEKLCSDEHDKHEKVIKEINNNSETVDYNGNDKTDPEILEAIIASLKDAEDAIVEPRPESSEKFDSEEKSSQSDHASSESKQTVEITKMDLGLEEVNDGLDHFSEGGVSGSPKNNLRENQRNSENQEQKVLVKKPIKRKKNASVIVSASSVKKAKGKHVETEDDDDMEIESYSDDDDNDVELPKGDTDYKPGKEDFTALPRSRRSTSEVELIVRFDCIHCNFHSEILGKLKIHQHNNHEDCEPPSYLDMAEAVVAKLDDTSGVTELIISKEVLFDHFDLIKSKGEDKARACQLLDQALRGGVKLGRLKVTRRRVGVDRFWVVPKEKMKLVMEKWRKFDKSVEFVDSTSKIGIIKTTKNMKKKIKSEVASLKVTPDARDDSDSDITILDVSLNSTTKQRLMRKNLAKSIISATKTQGTCPPIPPPATCPGSDEDDPHVLLTCPICFHSFWYENQTIIHMREEHPHNKVLGSSSVPVQTNLKVELQKQRNLSANNNMELQESGSAPMPVPIHSKISSLATVPTKAKVELQEPRNA
eukprot:GFUD01031160.1.p1 GENE.GFUD01031160.1~~GFUD01031160.1.p1  ORF type:complete len:538 (+),score=125.08 GFUD01031160.1:41-1654(+)